jgi:hypothetical protein
MLAREVEPILADTFSTKYFPLFMIFHEQFFKFTEVFCGDY